jgi:hypothetical protein
VELRIGYWRLSILEIDDWGLAIAGWLDADNRQSAIVNPNPQSPTANPQ